MTLAAVAAPTSTPRARGSKPAHVDAQASPQKHSAAVVMIINAKELVGRNRAIAPPPLGNAYFYRVSVWFLRIG
jgi:hypothetical protein